MKKILCAILITCLVFAGCAKKDTDINTETEMNVEQESEKKESIEANEEHEKISEENVVSDKESTLADDTKQTIQDEILNGKSDHEGCKGETVMETTKINDTEGFYAVEFTEESEIFSRIKGKSYKDDCTVPLSDLRYLHVLHMGFDGETHEGELICNKYIVEDLLEIFEKLYEAGYEIEKIKLVDEYDADDEASMSDNNSSAFNFRFISYTTKISKHGYGLAVDINTLYNPYVKTVDGNLSIEPANAAEYVDRTKDFPHKIDENDLAYKLFTEHGFEWGGSWTKSKDYQHFEMPDDVVSSLYP